MVNEWKVILLLCASVVAYDGPGRALSVYSQGRHNVPMFVPRTHKRGRARQSRVLFLDDDESRQPVGRGEIDLTQPYGSKIKFDDATDYDFTSPEDTTTNLEEKEASTNDRFYDAPRFRNFNRFPQFYQGRFSRPYAPTFGFDPYYFPGNVHPPAMRTSFYNPAQNGWKARSPRVVFPYQEPGNALQHTNSHAGPGPVPGAFSDNVVFREQNFGLNDVGTDDLALQDIGTGNADAFAERDANVPHRAKNERMDAQTSALYESTKYIPLYKSYEIKPMFIQTESRKILPPGLHGGKIYEYTNITKNYGGYQAVLPKFKPISDEQMFRISEILKELPLKSTNTPTVQKSTKNHRVRKGRVINDSKVEETKIEATTVEATTPNDRKDETCSQGGSCCGIAVGKQTAQRRIVGGDDAGFGTFPWQAYIRIGSSRLYSRHLDVHVINP